MTYLLVISILLFSMSITYLSLRIEGVKDQGKERRSEGEMERWGGGGREVIQIEKQGVRKERWGGGGGGAGERRRRGPGDAAACLDDIRGSC